MFKRILHAADCWMYRRAWAKHVWCCLVCQEPVKEDNENFDVKRLCHEGAWLIYKLEQLETENPNERIR